MTNTGASSLKSTLPALLLGTALLAGCGHIPVPYKGYEGPQKPQNEVATVQADWLGSFRAGYTLVIKTIDGQDIGGSTASPLDPRQQLVSVTPGPHTIGVDVSQAGSKLITIWSFTLAIDAKPDRLYAICLTPDVPPRPALVEVGDTSPRVVSQEAWQKFVTAACPASTRP